mgnify:CR=1 FL=1
MHCDLASLQHDIVSDVMRPPVFSASVGPLAFAFPFSKEVVASVVKGLVEALATNYGDTFNDLVLAQRDKIRAVVGPLALKSLDELIHGLQD